MKHPCVERHRFLPTILCAIVMLWLGGCSCKPAKPTAANQGSPESQSIEEMEAARRKRDAERDEKPDFEIVDLQVMPSDEPANLTSAKPLSHVKPGHWFGAVQRMKANNYDFPKGDLEAECVDEKVKSIKLPGEFELLTMRAVSLPKGQQKNTDLILFAPNTANSKFFFMSRLRPRGGGRQLDWQSELAVKMKASECHFVVLADRADNYQFFKTLRLANPHCAGSQFIEPKVDYRIKLPKGTQRVDLSSHPLTWTTIAYVLWDDFDPDILTNAQQQAMLDWLHWGGQLVVNGPRTLDRLSASFLSDYLPASATRTEKITDAQIAILNEHWSFAEPIQSAKVGVDDSIRRKPVTQDITVSEEKERPLCIQLTLNDRGQFAENTGELVAESFVGRGVIRVTAFNLPHTVFRHWAGYDGFINGCLLSRPARSFQANVNAGVVTENWINKTIDREDPRTTSQVRYFSRDATSSTGRLPEPKKRQRRNASTNLAQATSTPMADDNEEQDESDPESEIVSHDLPRVAYDTFGVSGFAQDSALGVAGWNDQSDVSRIAADALRKSAGIDIPSATFVAKVLGIYLLVLVPVNWLLFRLIGRVEWAWAMIPLLSIAGAVAVVRATELDIGFVRSRTEVAVLEMQPGYDRAHVTRYVGFYTSLSSAYEVTGDDESSLFLPLASEQRTTRNVVLQFGDSVKMNGFNVLSSSTGMIHSEQMLNVGGAVVFVTVADRSELQNMTNLDLQGVVVVRRVSDQNVEWARIGELKAQGRHSPKFELLTTPHVEPSDWDASTTASRIPSEQGLNIRALLDLATAPDRLGVGEAVLVGWTEQLIPGISVTPKASQVVARSVVVAQLHHAERPTPERDANSIIAQQQILDVKLREAQEDDEF